MQPRTLAIILLLLPLFGSNAAYLISASQGAVPWCVPYIEGCASISRSARSSDAIFLFRATMITYAVLMIWFWLYTRHWLLQLGATSSMTRNTITWLGIIGACSLIVYVVYLGSEGEVYRFMRRHGILWFFTLTPLAMLLLYRQHTNPANRIDIASRHSMALRFQLGVLILMLAAGLTNVGMGLADTRTDMTENIVEWLYSLLLVIYFAGMIIIWKHYRIEAAVKMDGY